MRFPVYYLIPIIFMILAGGAFIALQREDPDALPSMAVGKTAPAFTLDPLMGQTIEAADLAGDGVKIVNFWASWCAPCRVEHPYIEELAKDLPTFGVNYRDSAVQAQGFLAELGNPYLKIGADTKGRTGIDWGLYGVPETFIIGDDGVVLHRHAGPITQREMDGRFGDALRAALDTQ